MLVPFLTAAISMGVVYLYGAVGETLIEKGGSLNLGIPGIMCLGALGGVIGANVYGAIFGSNIIGVVLILFSIFFSITFTFFSPKNEFNLSTSSKFAKTLWFLPSFLIAFGFAT